MLGIERKHGKRHNLPQSHQILPLTLCIKRISEYISDKKQRILRIFFFSSAEQSSLYPNIQYPFNITGISKNQWITGDEEFLSDQFWNFIHFCLYLKRITFLHFFPFVYFMHFHLLKHKIELYIFFNYIYFSIIYFYIASKFLFKIFFSI